MDGADKKGKKVEGETAERARLMMVVCSRKEMVSYLVEPVVSADFPKTDSSTYMVGTEDGILHRCSVSYNEQYLDNYFATQDPSITFVSHLLVQTFSCHAQLIGQSSCGIQRKLVVNKGISCPSSQAICLITYLIYGGHLTMQTYLLLLLVMDVCNFGTSRKWTRKLT